MEAAQTYACNVDPKFCKKSFSTEKGLKQHISRSHKPREPIVEQIAEQPQQIAEQRRQITTPVQVVSEVSIVTQKKQTKDAETQAQLDSPIHTLPSCTKYLATIGMCVQESLRIDHRKNEENERKYGNFPVQTTQKFLESSFCDFDVLNNKLIAYDLDYKSFDISAADLFNQYETVEISDLRVLEYRPALKKTTSFKQFEFRRDDEIYTAMGCSQKSYWPIVKMMCENNIKCQKPNKNVRHIKYDIETYKSLFSCDKGLVPQFYDGFSGIAMIAATFRVQNQKTQVVIYTLTRYVFNTTIIKELLKQKNVDAAIEVKLYDLEKEMCCAFLEDCNDENYINVACGFNASQGQEVTDAYDLPWILDRAGVNIKDAKQAGSQWFNGACRHIYRVNGYLNTIFVDFKQLAYSWLQNYQIVSGDYLANYTLDSILGAMGVGEKISHDYTQMNSDFLTGGTDLSHWMAYCAYDALSLDIADQKHNLFEQKVWIVNEYKLPLSFAFKVSDAMVSSAIVNELIYKRGFSVFFGHYGKQEFGQKHGALTRAVTDEFLYQIVPVIPVDFASQYPNSILQAHIDVNTIVAEPNENTVTVDLNIGIRDSEPHFVHFDKTIEPVIHNLIMDLIKLKSQYKREGNKIAERSTKIIVNSIYGILNQNSSNFYRFEVGSAVTAFARQTTIEAVKMIQNVGLQVLTIDTDGFEIRPKSPEDIAKIQAVADDIQRKYPNMVLEVEKNPSLFIFPASSKSYLKMSGKKLTIKGCGSTQRLSKKCRILVEEFFKSCFEVQMPENDRDQIIDVLTVNAQSKRSFLADSQHPLVKHAQEFVKRVQTRLSSFDSVDQFEDYTILIKRKKQYDKRGNLTTSGYLQNQNGLKDAYHVIPYNTDSDKQAHNYATLNWKLDIKRVNIAKLTKMICAQVVNFFKLDSLEAKPVKKNFYDQAKQKDGEIIVVKQIGTKYDAPFSIAPQKLAAIIQNDGMKNTYHEVIRQDKVKCHFDIDYAGTLPIGIVKAALVKLFPNQIFAIASAEKRQNGAIVKSSYHAIGQFVVNKTQNYLFAQRLNNLIELQGYDGAVDLQIYSKLHNLRLPHCVKQSKFGIEKRLFRIILGDFADMLVTDISNVTSDLSEDLSYIKLRHFMGSVDSQFTDESKKAAIGWLEQNYPIKIETVNNNIVIPQKPYKCPVCERNHESQNMSVNRKYFSCFSMAAGGTKKKLMIPDEFHLENVSQLGQKIDLQPLINAEIVNQPEVEFSIQRAKHVFIRSAMGTGKTKSLLQQIEGFNKVVAVSFRRTFATDFAAKAGLVNYMTIKDQDIELQKTPKVCVQIDSLNRICETNADDVNSILILDEIESILDQVHDFKNKPHMKVSVTKLVRFLQHFTKVVIMDAFLQQSTIDLISLMSGVDNQYVLDNQFQPKTDHSVEIFRGGKSAVVGSFKKKVLEQLGQNQRIYSFCSGISALQDTVETVKKEFPNKTVIYFHGKGDREDKQAGFSQTHQAFKNNQLLDVNTNWESADLIITTSTIIAGVSFEKLGYNVGVHFFSQNTINSLQFVQGLGRVRDLSDKKHFIFQDSINMTKGPLTPAEVSIDYFRKHRCMQMNHANIPMQLLDTYLPARHNCVFANNQLLLEHFLQLQGYQISAQKIQTAEKNAIPKAVGRVIIPGLQITQQEIEYISKMKDSDIDKIVGQDAVEFESKRFMVKFAIRYQKTAEQINRMNEELIEINGKTATVLQHMSDHQSAVSQKYHVMAVTEKVEKIRTGTIDEKFRNGLNAILEQQSVKFEKGIIDTIHEKQTFEKLALAHTFHRCLKRAVEIADKKEHETSVKKLFNEFGFAQGVQSANSHLKLIGKKCLNKRSNHVNRYSIETIENDPVNDLVRYILG